MRTLKFKIEVDGLKLKDYLDIHREDLDFIIAQANKNHLDWYTNGVQMNFAGKHEDLFTFLYDVAYRYDIELM